MIEAKERREDAHNRCNCPWQDSAELGVCSQNQFRFSSLMATT